MGEHIVKGLRAHGSGRASLKYFNLGYEIRAGDLSRRKRDGAQERDHL